jgi:hypothetical protein
MVTEDVFGLLVAAFGDYFREVSAERVDLLIW